MPLHVLLYRAFDGKHPVCSPTLILKPVGNGKLSKRDGDKLDSISTRMENRGRNSVWIQRKRIFPEAVVNFLALLGWNDGTEKELFTLEELLLDLNRVHKAGAKFDPDKTNGSIINT
jgi:glutamyl-tRNA synthetase